MENTDGDAIQPNRNERMADRPRPDAPQLDEVPLPVIDTDPETGDGPAVDDV